MQWHYGNHPVMLLPPGEYQLVLQPAQFNTQALVWPTTVDLKEGRQAVVKLDSGIALDMPKESGPLYAWDVARPDKPAEHVQSQPGDLRAMLLPPGEYRVGVQPVQFGGERLVWPVLVTVKQGEVATAKLDSGVRIELAKEAGPLYSWSVVRPDKPDEAVQWQYGDQTAMLVPPGEYHVAVQPTQFNSKRLVWQSKVRVGKGEHQTVKLTSGVTLEMPKEAGPLYAWDVAPADKPEERLQLQRGDHRSMLLPPGEYQVAVQALQFGSGRLVWPTPLTVKEGQFAAAKLGSSVRLDLPKDAQLYRWELVRAGKPDKPDKPLQFQPGDQRAMLAPPGTYQVAIQPTQFGSERLHWPAMIEVQEGKQAVLAIASGIKIVGPKDAAPAFAVRILPADGKQPVQHGSQTWAPQLLPPGTYRVEVRADGTAPWKLLAEKVVVEEGKLAQVQMPALPTK